MILVRQNSASKTHEKKLGLGLILPSDVLEGRIYNVSFYISVTFRLTRPWKYNGVTTENKNQTKTNPSTP